LAITAGASVGLNTSLSDSVGSQSSIPLDFIINSVLDIIDSLSEGNWVEDAGDDSLDDSFELGFHVSIRHQSIE